MDLATLGYAVDTGGLVRGEAALDSFERANVAVAATAAKADAEIKKTTASAGSMAGAAASGGRANQALAQSLAAVIAAADRVTAVITKLDATITAASGASLQAATSAKAAGAAFSSAGADASRAANQIQEMVASANAGAAALSAMRAQASRAANSNVIGGWAGLGAAGRANLQEREASQRLSAMGSIASGAKQAATATALASWEVTNLTRQISDVGVSLASGQSPFMVMVQQGAQIQEIMGSRGLGAVLEGVKGGLLAMLNPTTLVLGGLAAGAWLASAAWNAFSEDVEDVDDLLKKQATLVRDLKDAYGEAAVSADRFAAASLAVLGARSRASLAQNAVALRAEGANFKDAVSVTANRANQEFFGIAGEYKAFEGPLKAFFASLKAGKPDVEGLLEETARLADLDPTNDALQTTWLRLFELTPVLRGLAEEAERIKSARDFTSKEAVDRRRDEAYRQYYDSRTSPEAMTAEWMGRERIATIPVPGRNPRGSVAGAEDAMTAWLEQNGLVAVPVPGANPARSVDGYDPTAAAVQGLGVSGIPVPGRNPARDLTSSYGVAVQEALRNYEFEREQLSRTNEEQRAYNELKRLGVDANSALGQSIKAEVINLERARAAQRELVSTMDDLRSGTSSIISGLIKGQDVTQMIADRLANFGADKLTEALLGKSGTASGGLFGDMLSGMLGGGAQAMTFGTAQIAAGTVVINGGVSGGVPAGLPGAVANGLAPGSPGGAYAPTGSSVEIAARLLREREGFRALPYKDVNALRAGYGSDTTTDPLTGAVSSVTAGTVVTKEMAEADLYRRIGEFQGTIRGQVGDEAWARLNPGTQGALTSVAYNYGSLPGRVVPAVQGGDPNAISGAIEGLAGDNGGVNASRRMLEAAMVRESQAIGQLGQAATTATTSVGDFGGGVASVASALTGGGGGAPAAGASGGGGLLGAIFSGIGSLFSGGFATGGYIPPGRWGVVGERGPEPAFGGRTGMTVTPNMGGGGGAVVNINDYRSGGERPQVHSRRGPRGEEVLEVMIRDGVGQETREGGSIDRSMVSRGLDVPITRRA